MKKVKSSKEYFELYRRLKRQCDTPITNIYLSLDMVNRYIASDSLYFEEQDRGGVFLCDEQEYYRGIYYVDISNDWKIPPLDKALAIRTTYKKEQKETELELFETKLVSSGFHMAYSSIEMCIPLEAGDRLKKQKAMYDRILKKGNFFVSYLKEKDLDDMLALRKNTKEFHIYNFVHKCNAEYLKEIENEQYMGIYNEKEELCACIYLAPGLNFRTGDGICVKEEYKMKYGLGAALMCFVLDNAINGCHQKYVSWCEQQNLESMKFHRSMGFLNTGKIADEWVLEQRS